LQHNPSTIQGWARILILILPYMFSVMIFMLIGSLIAGIPLTELENPKTSKQELAVLISIFLGTLFILWFFIKFIDNEPFINLGFHFKNKLKDIYMGLFLGLLIMGGGYLVLLNSNEIFFLKNNFNSNEFLIMTGKFVAVAFIEEMLTRGYILRNLMYSFDKFVALVISSIIFSFMHGANPHMDWFTFLDLFLAGLLLGITYIYTKNLWFPITLHFSWNFFQSLFGFNVSGKDSYSWIEFEIKENNIFNVGDFGFEGSVYSSIIQIILIIAIVIYYEKKQLKKSISKTSLPANSLQ